MVPDGGLAHLVVDGQVRLVVFGEGGPGHRDSVLTCVWVTVREKSEFTPFQISILVLADLCGLQCMLGVYPVLAKLVQ